MVQVAFSWLATHDLTGDGVFLADEMDGVGSKEVDGSTTAVFMANIAWRAANKLLDSSVLKQ